MPLRQALELWERAFADGHPDVARGRVAVGRLLLERGALDSAEILLRRGLRVQDSVLGAGHPHTAETAHWLGAALARRGELAAAESLYLRAAEVYEDQLSPSAPVAARLRADLEQLYTAWGRPGRSAR